MVSERRLLRTGRGAGVPIRPYELFFDLVFVFAVTQLSHGLLAHLTPAGAAETLMLLLAVWWAWMYTSWATNWFDPDHPAVRLMLGGVMLAGLILAAAVPSAFGAGGLRFAGAYVAIQVGRTLFMVLATRHSALGRTFLRILCWHAATGVLWLVGALAPPGFRVALWALALVAEYAAPWLGYATPVLGRARTTDWTLDGEHMAERCRLFVMIALGESVLLTGTGFARHAPTPTGVGALVVVFAVSLAIWWLYFDHGAETAGGVVAASTDPGRLGRSAYTYLHIPLVAGVIVTAVGGEEVLTRPTGGTTAGVAAVVTAGPLLFVAGHGLFRRTVFGRPVRAALVACAALAVLGALGTLFLPPLALSGAVTVVLVALAAWYRRTNDHPTEPAGPTTAGPTTTRSTTTRPSPPANPPPVGPPAG